MRCNQPQSGPLQIDWGNPITRGLISVIDGMSGRDVLAGAPSVDSMARSTGTSGIGRNFTTTSYATFPFKRARITNKFSYFMLLDWGGGSGNSFIFGDVETGSAGYNSGLYSNGVNFLFFVKTGGSATNIASTTGSSPSNARLRLAGTYDGATMRQYINGVQEGSAAKTGNVDAGAFSLNINRWNAGSGHTGRFYLGLVWNRDLSAAENASLAANPGQIFASVPRIVWASAAGGAATYSYTATGGFVLSGSATKVRGIARTASGGVTLSGAAVQSRGAVRSSSGGILLSGAAAIAKGKAVTAAGGLTISGAATVLRGVVRSAAGGMQLAGAATVSFFSAVQSRVVNPVGGMILGGAAAIVRSVRKLAAGGLTFGGHATVTIPSATDAAASFNQSTIMRATVTNRSSPATQTSIAAISTMRSSFSQSTIMRDDPINGHATISSGPLNMTANLL